MSILEDVVGALDAATGSTGPATIDTPLGDDVRFQVMGGIEALSQLFAYQVDVTSDRSDIAASELLGQSVTVHLATNDDDGDTRHWNGRVTEVTYIETSDDGTSRYRMTLRPWLWQLSQCADCRIFQQMSIPDIVTQVFQGRGFTDFTSSLSGTYETHDYVVQYRETDLEFVTRLLEREGIYYFFKHEDGKHTLVLADSPQAHSPAPGSDSLPFQTDDAHRDATMQYVGRWQAEGALRTAVYVQTDYDFTKPQVTLSAQATATDDDAEPADALQIYDFPGGFDSFADADAYTRLRLDQTRREVERRMGETNARGLAAGTTFTLTDHPRDAENKQYLATWSRVRVTGQDANSSGGDEATFTLAFVAIASDVTFRPPWTVRKPVMRGPQTAMVVGPDGQEIWTDQYGRIKVQFPWDRLGQDDENSSCWMRVAQQWAGSGFGAQFIPRIGQEVIVDFLDGDPDRPIITGSVYNGSNGVPFELPDQQTRSGWKTRSTPGGALDAGNELRFEDAVGAEEVYLQAQKDMNVVVKNNQSTSVAQARAVDVGGAETISIALTRSLQVGAASFTTVGADSTETVGAARKVQVGGSNLLSIAQGSNVKIGTDFVTHIGGALQCDVAGSSTRTVSGDENLSVGGKFEVRFGDEASYIYATAAKTVVGHPDREANVSTFIYGASSTSTSKDVTLESDTSITLQCGNTSIVITPDGVTITGKTLTLNAGSTLAVSSPNASLTLDDNVTAIGKKATISSSGAQLALDGNAALTGSQVKLGSGSGSSASASGPSSSPPSSLKPVFIRTRILRNGKPAAGVSYKLTLDGVTDISGTTTGDGLVEQKVPATVSTVQLVLLDTNETRTFAIAAIEPPDTTLGAQQRLTRLGYYHGALDGTTGMLFVHALQAFQSAQGLDASGALDSGTQGALKKAYGS
jgi:type VI secretion system secreted protein VgrG